MGFAYLDIETTGKTNPEEEKITSIQYQYLDKDFFPIGKMIILKEYKSSEEEIVREFYKILYQGNKWKFIPIMQNGLFDFRYLFCKFKKYGLIKESEDVLNLFYNIPIIDIHSMLVLVNKGEFVGSGLDNLTKKEHSGKYALDMYEQKNFTEFENYVSQEKEAFLDAVRKLFKHLNGFNLKDDWWKRNSFNKRRLLQ